MIHLRMHHLFCSVLFQGKGYSPEFVTNMTQIVDALKCPDTLVHLTTSQDIICKDCPNALADGRCGLDEIDDPSIKQPKEISTLDARIAAYFQFSSKREYTSGELYQTIDSKLTHSFFEECCQNCRWYQQGLCSYEAYRKNLSIFLDAKKEH